MDMSSPLSRPVLADAPLPAADSLPLQRRPSSSATQSSTSEPTVKIYLHYAQEPYREAYLYRENTLAQLKQAVRTSFGLPASHALHLHLNGGEVALHEQAGNQDSLYGLVNSGDIVHITLSNQTVASRKSPRLIKFTKKMGRSWRQKRNLRKTRGVAADGDTSLGSTPPSAVPVPLSQNHQRSVSDVSMGSLRSVTFQNTPPSSPAIPPIMAPTVLRHQQSSSSVRSAEITRAFYCPILLHLMADPVTAEDGVTYDRPAIEGHFARLHKEAAQAHHAATERSHEEDLSDDDVSIPATPAAAILTVLWSPMTREVISDALVPNRSIEQMIVEAVESGQANLSPADLEDWYQRRLAKLEHDRQRASARKLLRLSVSSLPEENGEGDEDDHILDTAALHPADTLQNLVRVDRPHLSERMGGHDSGLAAVAVGDVEARSSLRFQNEVFCAVGFCVERIPLHDEIWCPRCQRAVCRECRKTQITDIRSGSSFKPYEICCDCVLQLADVLFSGEVEEMTKHRMNVLANHVKPRMEACWTVIHRLSAENDIGHKSGTVDATVEEETSDDDPTMSTNGSFTQELKAHDDQTPLCALGVYPRDETTSLNLSFPTPSMSKILTLMDTKRGELEEEEDLGPSTLRIWSEFCQFVPPEKSSCRGSMLLRMCPFCRAGPYEKPTGNGCSNCGGGRPDEFDQWPPWDEIAGPH